ncbi:hypothetical protein BC941DRAFT_436389 [Chlamydoabsidia padenii]|nr:hypothetical protein BC941DRAFT_436389 [Chlamydoabsidia padenii]
MSGLDNTECLQAEVKAQERQDAVESQKQLYENMTYDEMARHMKDNYKELSDILNSQQLTVNASSVTSLDDEVTDTISSLSSSTNVVMCDDERIVDQSDIDDTTKRIKMNKLFSRAASSGDLERLELFLKGDNNKYRQYIDINVKDEDGTTPLIYASCFGKIDIVQTLLDANADTNVQDSFGWSALMWATNNNHEQIVKLLLDHGASSNTRSSKGRTVMDFINTEKNQKLADIILSNSNSNSNYNVRDSLSSTTSSIAMGRNQSSTSSMLDNDHDFYYQSTMDGFDSFVADEAERRQKLLEATLASLTLRDNDSDLNLDDSNFDEDYNNFDKIDNDIDVFSDGDEGDEYHFCWDKCLPDQMFVFNQENLPKLLDSVIKHAQDSLSSSLDSHTTGSNVGLVSEATADGDQLTTVVWAPANIIFLLARFAHYFCTTEVLDEVLQGSLERINRLVNAHSSDINVLTYWMTNFTQLLYYLKKDHGLVSVTAQCQLYLSEYISESYTLIIHEVQTRLSKLLEPGMLGYGVIPGMEDVNFADDWQRFFRRNNQQQQQTSLPGVPTTVTAASSIDASALGIAATPRTVISILSSTLETMQLNKVQPTITIQALAQLLHYISCDLFNHVLKNKKLLCRSKALQIRMNLSYIEDWVRQHHLPTRLLSYLTPTVQLLQLLQCLSQLEDIHSLMDTLAACDLLNALQVKRCVVKYRYEVGERRISEDIEQYVGQLAGDMVRYRQARQSCSFDIPRSLPQQITNSTQNPLRTTTAAAATSMSRSSSDFPTSTVKSGTALRRSHSTSRPESMYQVLGNFMSSAGLIPSNSESSQSMSLQQQQEEGVFTSTNNASMHIENLDNQQETVTVTNGNIDDQNQVEDDEVTDMYETKDTKFLLPFKVPPMAHMNNAYCAGWLQLSPSEAANRYDTGKITITTTGSCKMMIPTIPDAWMDVLDRA